MIGWYRFVRQMWSNNWGWDFALWGEKKLVFLIGSSTFSWTFLWNLVLVKYSVWVKYQNPGYYKKHNREYNLRAGIRKGTSAYNWVQSTGRSTLSYFSFFRSIFREFWHYSALFKHFTEKKTWIKEKMSICGILADEGTSMSKSNF